MKHWGRMIEIRPRFFAGAGHYRNGTWQKHANTRKNVVKIRKKSLHFPEKYDILSRLWHDSDEA